MEIVYVVVLGIVSLIMGGLIGGWAGYRYGVKKMREREPWRKKISIYETLYALIKDSLRRSEKNNEGPYFSAKLYEEIQLFFEKNKLPIMESHDMAGLFEELFRLQPTYIRAYDTREAPAGYAQLYPKEAKEFLRDICHVLEEEVRGG